MLRQNQRALNKAMRDLDRERQHMEQQEKKIIADIKKMAKQGQMVMISGIVLARQCYQTVANITVWATFEIACEKKIVPYELLQIRYSGLSSSFLICRIIRSYAHDRSISRFQKNVTSN